MKNVFKLINWVASIILIMSMCSLDGEKWILPTITMFVLGLYLGTVLMIHNYNVYVRGEE